MSQSFEEKVAKIGEMTGQELLEYADVANSFVSNEYAFIDTDGDLIIVKRQPQDEYPTEAVSIGKLETFLDKRCRNKRLREMVDIELW